VHAAAKVEAEPDLLEGDEEIPAPKADEEGEDEAPKASLGHGNTKNILLVTEDTKKAQNSRNQEDKN
jgi:hypothetical protein